jgi:hypothetical protein
VSRLRREFEAFDAANPQIWDLFVRFTFMAIRAGKKKGSISLITERIRWEVYIETASNDEFKINNNHRAYYARKWQKLYPEYADFFETRRLRDGEEPDLFELL